MQNYNNQRNLHTSSSTANLNTRYNNAPRYAVPTPSTGISSDSVTPLIPERTSSNNEQVLDWVKSFNIPKRPIANSARLNSNARLGYNISSSNLPINSNMNQNTNNGHYPISPSSPRVGDDGQWKFVRRRPNNGQIPINTSASNVNQHYMVNLILCFVNFKEDLTLLLFRIILRRSLHHFLHNSNKDNNLFTSQKTQIHSTVCK